MTKKQNIKLGCLLLMLLSFALLFLPTPLSFALENGSAQVIATKCNLYCEATFSSDKVTVMDEDDQPVIITLHLGDEVEVSQIQGDFAFITTEKGIEGWAYCYYLSQSESQQVYPVFNGTVRKETLIYDADGQSTGNLAKEGARVYLFEGFDSKKEMTAVQIALEDGSLFVGYISTTDIEPDGVSKMLIVAITVIVATVTIVLSLVFIRKKIKKKKEKKEK